MNKDLLIMTPGPTEIDNSVLEAMATKGTNPDLDGDFYEIYKETAELYNKLIGCKEGESYFLAGEGILGLEAACASIIEDGDKVLCIANGIFGDGFKGFIEMYGGEVIMVEQPWDNGLDLEGIKEVVKANPGIKAATIVHCETPTGITNDIEKICQFLNEEGIISIVDSVSAIGGEHVDFDGFKIDILLGGSQKCLSSPAGMTMVTVSQRAKEAMKSRKSPIKGYYLNLTIWEGWYEKKWFPYTQPLQNIVGLKKSIENALSIDFKSVHRDYAELVRKHLTDNGLKIYGNSSLSNTVTTAMLPDGVKFDQVFDTMKNDHNILIGGGFGPLKDKIFRIGHMGSNNKDENFTKTFEALKATFEKIAK